MPETSGKPLKVGDLAPAFSLRNDREENVSLQQFRGQHVVLYFYPKDGTPGCTTEALEFQGLAGHFSARNVAIIGISPDIPKRHAKFKEKFGLHFQLLSDTEHTVTTRYGLWVEKSMYGRKFMGVQRATFLIDPEGAIAHIWPKVRPKGHAAAVLEHLASLA